MMSSRSIATSTNRPSPASPLPSLVPSTPASDREMVTLQNSSSMASDKPEADIDTTSTSPFPPALSEFTTPIASKKSPTPRSPSPSTDQITPTSGNRMATLPNYPPIQTKTTAPKPVDLDWTNTIHSLLPLPPVSDFTITAILFRYGGWRIESRPRTREDSHALLTFTYPHPLTTDTAYSTNGTAELALTSISHDVVEKTLLQVRPKKKQRVEDIAARGNTENGKSTSRDEGHVGEKGKSVFMSGMGGMGEVVEMEAMGGMRADSARCVENDRIGYTRGVYGPEGDPWWV